MAGLDGELETFAEGPNRERNVFARHWASQFTGETTFLNGRESLVSTQACRETRVIRVPRAAFRRLLATEPDISEIVMRAFILRRVGFLRHGHGGTAVSTAGSMQHGPGAAPDRCRSPRSVIIARCILYRMADL